MNTRLLMAVAVLLGLAVLPQAFGEAAKLPPVDADQNDVPQIAAETAAYHMGSIANNKATKGAVKIYNRGTKPLEITKIGTSCGCTKGKMQTNGEVIPPGEERNLEVTVDPFRIPGFTSTKILTLESNDPKKPAIKISVTADVIPEYTLEPAVFALGDINKGETRELEIVFRPAPESGVNLVNVKPVRVAQGLTIEIEDRAKTLWKHPEAPEKVIKLEFDSNEAQAGKYTGYISVETDAKRLLKYQRKITANILSFYKVDKSTLSLGMLTPGRERASTATISSDQELEIIDVKVTGDAFTATTQKSTDGKSHRLTVAYSGSETPGRKTERLEFKVKAGDKIVSDVIRVFGVVRAKKS
jgi:hypothetical protein